MSEAAKTDRRHAGWRIAAAAILALLVTSCDGSEIGISRIREDGEQVKAGWTTLDRFSSKKADEKQPSSAADQIAEVMKWRVPEGFEQLPSKPLRVVNLRAGDAECYLTTLTGGTADSNINRWRGQMGLPKLDTSGIAGLKVEKTMLLGPTYRVDLTGTYASKPGYRMLAAYAQFPRFAISVKMIGPEAAVTAGASGFEEFVTSLAWRDAPEETGQPDLKWDVPSSWTKGQGHPMRYVTYKAGKSGECFITFLGPAAGDWKPNVARWTTDTGVPMLDDKEIAALPKITLLGKETPMLEVASATKAMLGVMAKLPAGTMFVKLTGSPADIVAEKSNFAAFCKSLRMEQ